MNEFATCFVDADTVLIADVYAAGEAPIEGVNRDMLVGLVQRPAIATSMRCRAPGDLPGLIWQMARPGDRPPRAHARDARARLAASGRACSTGRGRGGRPRLNDPESERKGAQPLQAVAVPDGYALYAVRGDRDDEGPAAEVTIRELLAATPAARALLWEFLLDQDLTRTITWALAPADEPLGPTLTDPDAVRIVLDRASGCASSTSPPRSPPAPTPATPTSCSKPTDAFCPWNAGRWRLAGGGCEPTEAQADLALDVSALGAAYLGGTAAEPARCGGPGGGAAPGRAGAGVGRVSRRCRAVVP